MTTSIRRATIEGTETLIVESNPPLPAKLDALLRGMSHVAFHEVIQPTGASNACTVWRTHRFGILQEGVYVCLDGIVRDLRIQMCRDCGACCVRDISFDRLPGLPLGRSGAARRDLILGWYSGARSGQRQHL